MIKTKCQRINAQQCSRTKDRRIGWACPTYSTKYGIQGSGVWSWISVELIRGSGLKHTISTSFSDRKEIPWTFSHSIAFHHRWHFLRPVSKEGKPVIYLFIICPLFFLCCSLCGCICYNFVPNGCTRKRYKCRSDSSYLFSFVLNVKILEIRVHCHLSGQ